MLWVAGWLTFCAHPARAENVILHLRNEDRVAGTIVSENTNSVVLTNSLLGELRIPVSAIQRRESVTNAAPTAAVLKPAPTTSAPEPMATNAVAATPTTPPPAPPAPSAPAPKPPKPKLWKGNLSLGTDTQVGARDHQIYSGRLNVTYARPYKSNPKKFFRTIFDYAVDYGKTDGVKSSDRMYGSLKTDFDVGRRIFVYNLAAAGYNDILRINLEYQLGPGLGYHLFTRTNFVMNVEGGLNYQVQERSGSPNVRTFYYRLAEDFTWKINSIMTLTEKAEFFPRAENPEQYRARFDSTLSFPLWRNLSLNLSVLDLYDTNPAQGVNQNELQIRSMLQFTF